MPIQFVDGANLKTASLVVVVYGQPNIGKTTLGLTAEKPVLLDFDTGAHRAGNKAGKDIAVIKNWNDIAALAESDLANHKTVVVDTVGTCLDVLAADIIKNEPRLGFNGALTQQGYGRLKARFRSWLNNLRSFGKDVVLIAHSTEEPRKDNTVVDRIVAAGSSKQEIYQQADLMGAIKPRQDGQRVLSFDLSENSYGKNVGLPEFIIGDPKLNPTLLADIIKSAKREVNSAQDKQSEESTRVNDLRTYLSNLDKAAAVFNEVLVKMQKTKAKAVDRNLLVKIGTEAGLKFDKEKKEFIDPDEPKEVPVEEVPVEDNPFG